MILSVCSPLFAASGSALSCDTGIGRRLMNDIAHPFRTLAKNSGLAISIISLLALGTGTTTLMFSAFDRVMLRTLPVRDPDQLVRLVQKFQQAGTRSQFPYAGYDALNHPSRTFTPVFVETQV